MYTLLSYQSPDYIFCYKKEIGIVQHRQMWHYAKKGEAKKGEACPTTEPSVQYPGFNLILITSKSLIF